MTNPGAELFGVPAVLINTEVILLSLMGTNLQQLKRFDK